MKYMIEWAAVFVVSAAATCAPAAHAQYATATENSANNRIASLLVSGTESARTLRVVFDTAAIPADLAAPYLSQGGEFQIAAVLPDGSVYSFVRGSGWQRSAVNALAAAFKRKTFSVYDQPQPETVIESADLSSLVGTALYAGIGVGSRLTYSYVGSILPIRQAARPVFPFASGEWSVSRAANPVTDAVTCSLAASPVTADGRYRVRFAWDKLSKAEPITLGMALFGATTGSFLFNAHPGNSMMRVGQWPATSMNGGTGAAYYLPLGATKVQGPQRLYGNWEPNVSRMMAEQTLTLQFVSAAGTTSYLVQASLAGIGAAIDAFDACIATQ